MNKTVDYKGRQVHYSIDGSGETLVFLHGYLESSQIWRGFTERFAATYQVLCIDIPGHGKSETIGQVHHMEEMARVVDAVAEEEKIDKLILFGHSMGGYLTMEYVHLFPEKVRGYCLLHSTCFADDEEKKLNRDREISLVKCGKKMQIIRTNIPKAFAEASMKIYEDRVNEAIEIAAMSPDDGVIALLRGMKERNDHSKLLANTAFSPLLIWGEKDNYIGEKVFKSLLRLAPHATVLILNNSGHMGFVEEADSAYNGMMSYLTNLK